MNVRPTTSLHSPDIAWRVISRVFGTEPSEAGHSSRLFLSLLLAGWWLHIVVSSQWLASLFWSLLAWFPLSSAFFWLFSPKSYCLFVFYFRQSSLYLCPLSSQSFDSPLFSLFFNPSLFLSSLSWSVFQSILSSAVFSFFSFGWPVYFGCLCLLPAVNVLFRATFRPLFSSSRPFLSLLLSLSFWFLFFNPLFGHLSSVFGPLWSAYCTFFSPLFAQFAVLSSNFVCSSLHLSFGQLSVLSTLFSFQYLFFLSSLSWLVTRWLPSLLTVLQSFLTSLSWFVPFFIYGSLVFKLSERTYLSGK